MSDSKRPKKQKLAVTHTRTFLVDRRDFLKLSGLTVGAGLAPGLVGCTAESVGETLHTGIVRRGFVATVRRPQDFVALQFEFVGLVLDLLKVNLIKSGNGPHLVIVHFPSQHLLEGALADNAQSFPSVVPALLSGPSRLVFQVPNGVDSIPYSLQALLELCEGAALRVSKNAIPGASSSSPIIVAQGNEPELGLAPELGALANRAGMSLRSKQPGPGPGPVPGPELPDPPGAPEPPAPTETAIELPYRLIVSPNHYAGFAHAAAPVEAHGRTELWHTRMGIRAGDEVDEYETDHRTLRAIWARDEEGLPAPGFVASLTPGNRLALMHQSADFQMFSDPAPVDVRRLMLTSLGGYLDVRGEWQGSQIALWEHRAALGRDNYVKIVENGYLYPSGHRAVLITITERKLQDPQPHTAYLYQRCFLVVKEPLKHYAQAGRDVPFQWMHINQLVSPLLDDCAEPAPFVPMVDGKPFRFPVEVMDAEDNLRRFDMPMVWVKVDLDGTTPLNVPAAAAAYENVNTVDTAGQRFAFAPEDEIGDTSFETRSLSFVAAGVPGSPGFAPGLLQAEVQVEAARGLGAAGGWVPVQYAQPYLSHGFGGNNAKGQVLLETVGDPVDLSFSGDTKKSGGFLSPGMKITALSRKKGPIGGKPGDFAAGSFKAEEFFGGIDAMLFGCIPLMSIIDSTGLDDAPGFATQTLDAIASFVNDLFRVADLVGELGVSGIGGELGKVVQNGASALVDPSFDFVTALSELGSLASQLETLTVGAGQDAELRLLKRLVADLRRTLDEELQAFQTAIAVYKAGEELIKNQTVRLEWRPKIKGDPLGFFEPLPPQQMLLSVEARGKDLPGKPAGVDLIAALPNFNLNLLGKDATFMTLEFEKIQVRVVNGKKPEIDVVFKNMAFDGVLAFVQKLTEVLPLEGFSDPPNVEVSAEGLKAMFTLPLPNIAVGMFSLENMSLSAGFHIPFLGPPVTVYFGFCTRESPFRITVSMLGGGGFFGITVSPFGMELLEASFEFGASLSVDFGVASGSISIMAGIYFAMGKDTASLTGYLRARGEVDVLGLITASIELYMELKYEFSSHKVIGKASIEIEVCVVCFSATVTVTAERKFAGSNEDPTFEELMAPQGVYEPFTEYMQAFAA